MNLIAKLSSSTSHHLEAEQVIPDLAAAVKELFENSLDSTPSYISNNIIPTFIDYYRRDICKLRSRFGNCRRRRPWYQR